MIRYLVRVVASPELASGFALAGLPVVEADSTDDGAEHIVRLAGQEEVGIILAEDRFVNALSEGVRRDLWRRATPILVPFARPSWAEVPEAAEAYIVEILQRAIGYRVRLR